MTKTSVIVQQSFTLDNTISHYIAESTPDKSFVGLRVGDSEEWSEWVRGNPLVDIACFGNGYHVDLHENNINGDDTITKLTLDYDTAANLYLALDELYRGSGSSGGKMILKRFVEVEE